MELVNLIVTVAVAFVVAYITARLQLSSAKEQETRALLDRATAALPDIRLKLGWSRSDLINTVGDVVRRRRLEELDAARVVAEEVADLLLTHAGKEAPVNIRFREALIPAREARDVLVDAADRKIPTDALGGALTRIDALRREFDTRHEAYLSGAHDYIVRGRHGGLLGSVARGVERSRTTADVRAGRGQSA